MFRKQSCRRFSLSSLCLLCTVTSIALLVGGSGCSGSPSDGKTELDAPGTIAIPANGWSTLKMNGYNYADTELDTLGHFKTVPNGCHQDAAGAIGVGLWNKIASDLNRAVTLPVLSDDNALCFNRPTDSKLYGTVDLVLAPRDALYSAEAPRPSSAPTSDPTVFPTHPTSTPTSPPTTHPTSTPTVTPTPSPSAPQVTRTILEDRGDQICTTFKDAALAQDLVNALDQLATIAYKEDCERVP